MINMFSVRFDEYFLGKKVWSTLKSCWPKCCLNWLLCQKYTLRIGQIMICQNGRGVFTDLVLRASYYGRKDFGTSFSSLPDHTIISNIVLKISSHEVGKKKLIFCHFWRILLCEVFIRQKWLKISFFFQLHEKIFSKLC